MADIPFIDTHFHLHDMKRSELRYSWLEPAAVHGFLGNIDALKAYYDLFMTSPDGVGTLGDVYGVPYERMVVVSHHEFDIRM